MRTITTAAGQTHEVLWCGVSDISGMLFFDLVDGRRAAEIIAEFDDPENTGTFTYNDGKTDRTYTGYTRLEGFNRNGDIGAVRLALARPAVN